MHKNFLGARAYIPYATDMLQKPFTSMLNMLRRIQQKAEARRVHPSSQEIFCMQKCVVVFSSPEPS